MIPHLQNNLSSWDHDLQYKLMCGKTIEKRLSRLLVLAAKMSYPNASKVKVNHFLQSSGDLFEFYEKAESEAPESESGPVLLCSKCSAPLSRSDLDISVETQHQPSYLESPARRPLERADSQLLVASPALSTVSSHSDYQPDGPDGWHPEKDGSPRRCRSGARLEQRDTGTQTDPSDFQSSVDERNDLCLANFMALLEESEI